MVAIDSDREAVCISKKSHKKCARKKVMMNRKYLNASPIAGRIILYIPSVELCVNNINSSHQADQTDFT